MDQRKYCGLVFLWCLLVLCRRGSWCPVCVHAGCVTEEGQGGGLRCTIVVEMIQILYIGSILPESLGQGQGLGQLEFIQSTSVSSDYLNI